MNVITVNFLWNYVIIKKTHYFSPNVRVLTCLTLSDPTQHDQPNRFVEAPTAGFLRGFGTSLVHSADMTTVTFLSRWIKQNISILLHQWIHDRRRKSIFANLKSICIPFRLDLWTNYVKMVHIWWMNFVRLEYKS